MKLSDEVCLQARALIAGRLGLDFPEGRRADLERGFIRACRTSSISAPEAYLAWLARLPDGSQELMRLAGYLTVGETYFFRGRACFEALEQQILPSLITARRAGGILRLRLWSAWCATGEEPYSLAILLDRLLPDLSDWAQTILATDINPEALETAKAGEAGRDFGVAAAEVKSLAEQSTYCSPHEEWRSVKTKDMVRRKGG